jgi:tRNA(fMet)-specific endonuclease VapC
VEKAYRELAEAVRFLAQVRVVDSDAAAIARYQTLQGLKLNIGKYDLKIAAIALEVGAVVVTGNVRDFQRVPNLAVEDWTQPAAP